MTSLLRYSLLGLVLSTAAWASPVKVTASPAIRIALVDTVSRQTDSQQLHEVLAPCFAQAFSQIYGAETPVEFVRVSAESAADGLRRGIFDAGLVFSKRLPSSIKRTGYHCLRAVAGQSDARGGEVAYLVLRQEEPKLDSILANAFSVAVNHRDVLKMLMNRQEALVVAGH